MTRQCDLCGVAYEAVRKKSRYCSDTCGKRARLGQPASGLEEKMEEKTRSSRFEQVRSRLISRAPTESEKLKVMLIVWDSSFIVWMCVCDGVS